MSVKQQIFEYARNLSEKRIFCTKEILFLSRKRGNIDQALSVLVKDKVLRRLSRGVFCLNEPELPPPGLLEIAKAKAKAFGKQIAIHGRDALKFFGVKKRGNSEITFASNGKSSSFMACGKRIHFRGTTMNRVSAGDSKAGLLVRALAELKARDRTISSAETLCSKLSHSDWYELRRFMPQFMTAWMIELLFNSGIEPGAISAA